MTTQHNTEPRAVSRFDQQLARIAVGGYDDAQEIRTATMNRVRDVIRKKNEGIPFDAVEDEKDDRDYDDKYADDELADLIDEMLAAGRLTDREYSYLADMLETANIASELEAQYKNVMRVVEAEPIYTEWLDNVNGVSVTLTARLIHAFGYCEDFSRVSNLWSYSGYAPGQKRERGEQLNYSPDAKKLGWLVADSFIKQGDRSKYRTKFYDPYKSKQMRRMERAEDMTDAQLNEKPWTPPESKGHADARARRYVAKKFLKHYWAIARDMAGEDVPDEWVITHGGHEKETHTFENPFHAKRVLSD